MKPVESRNRSRLEDELTALFAEARRGGRDTVPYVEPKAEELATFRATLARALDRIDVGETPEAPQGFAFTKTGDGYVLRELPNARRGAGAYALRKTTGRAAIGAPHTFWDAGTLPIAITAFAQSDARSLAINTVHRYVDRVRGAGGAAGGEASGDEDDGAPSRSDLAHQEQTFFQVVHEELAKRGAFAVQLHGFRDEMVPGASLVVSAARTNADAPARASVVARTGARALVYGRDTKKLGGTTNVQAQSCVRAGQPFLHVEMSKTLRDELGADERKRAEFVKVLLGDLR